MKVLAAETNLGSATNISNAPVVRLFNSGTDNILVTRKDYNAVVVGSLKFAIGACLIGEGLLLYRYRDKVKDTIGFVLDCC